MRYIFITGLEHSGTTLTDFLLSKVPDSIGLGEVASFFDPGHMQNYMQRWGQYDDVRLCSCKADWADCEFWQELEHLNGLNSTLPMAAKYKSLIQHVRASYPADVNLIDSSKNAELLLELYRSRTQLGLSHDDMVPVFTFKSAPEFAFSITRKTGQNGLVSLFRSFNWWVSVNKQILELLSSADLPFVVNDYRRLTQDPARLLVDACGISRPEAQAILLESTANTHIAMGNKNFSLRNRDHIEYDAQWRSDWRTRLIQLLHFPARRLYHRLSKLNSVQPG